MLLSDGGILDNVPVDVAKGMVADVVTAVKVGSPQFDDVSESLPRQPGDQPDDGPRLRPAHRRHLLAGIAELGSAFDELDIARLKWSGGVAITGDTFFGPVYFGFALGNGWSYRGYVTIGRLLP